MYRFNFPLRLLSRLGLPVALWALAALAPAMAANPPSAAVGKATMVIGQAYLVSDEGEVSAMDRGSVVRVGDRIETGANGHVHLRFTDGGLVSVRPDSRLQIQKYSYTEGQPEAGGIKFKLEQGVVRSITGAWGEAARERFRLNTPLAAIGVKGTDFVVSANANTTLASVYAGAIVIAPLLGDCQATLGPCVTGAERLLTQDMKGQMVSLVGQQGTPQLVASADLVGRAQRSARQSSRSSAGCGKQRWRQCRCERQRRHRHLHFSTFGRKIARRGLCRGAVRQQPGRANRSGGSTRTRAQGP